MAGNRFRLILGRGLMLAPLLFLGLFFFYPLASILELSLFPDGHFEGAAFERILTSDYYRGTLWLTTRQAVYSTLLTLALALPGAHVFARYQFAGKSALLALATLPFVLPTVVVAAAFTSLLGPRGTLNAALMDIFALDSPPIRLQRTLTLILIAHVFYNYAVALRIISSFWATQNRRIQEAATILGASPWMVFWRVTLPLLFPAILAAGSLVFVFTFTSFGVVLILGGLEYRTLEVEIYQQTMTLNLPVAAALSLVQLAATLLMMIVYTSIQRATQRPLSQLSARRAARRPRSWGEWAWVGVNVLVIVVLIFLPLLALIEQSFTVGRDVPTLEYYKALSENRRGSLIFVPPIEAVTNSLRYAAITTLWAVGLGTLAAYLLAGRWRGARWLDPLFMLPLATSAVTLGFGFIIALDSPPLNLRRSFWIIPIAHTLVAMPFVVRTVLPALSAIRPSLREAAAVLGESAWRRWWRVELPLISRSILVGATFAFTMSMGEFGASVFLTRYDQPTLPVVISRFLGQPAVLNYGQGLALSVILMAVCAAGFWLIGRLNRAALGEF